MSSEPQLDPYAAIHRYVIAWTEREWSKKHRQSAVEAMAREEDTVWRALSGKERGVDVVLPDGTKWLVRAAFDGIEITAAQDGER